MQLTIKSGKLVRATPGSAGFDIFCDEEIVVVEPGKRRLVMTGLVTSFDRGHVGLIRDRSGHAFKHGITVLAGVIDADYDREWGVVLLNTGVESFVIRRGDRIAQVLFLQLASIDCASPGFDLRSDQRGGGFGSTGG